MALNLFELISPSVELKLNGPDGEPLPVTLRVQGLNVPSIKAKGQEASAYLIQAQKTENVDTLVKHLQRAEKIACEMAALAVVGWDNDDYMGGPYTPEYCKTIMARPDMEFLRKQVNQHITDERNFFRDKPAVAPEDASLDS